MGLFMTPICALEKPRGGGGFVPRLGHGRCERELKSVAAIEFGKIQRLDHHVAATAFPLPSAKTLSGYFLSFNAVGA